MIKSATKMCEITTNGATSNVAITRYEMPVKTAALYGSLPSSYLACKNAEAVTDKLAEIQVMMPAIMTNFVSLKANEKPTNAPVCAISASLKPRMILEKKATRSSSIPATIACILPTNASMVL